MKRRFEIRLWLLGAALCFFAGCIAMIAAGWFHSLGLIEIRMPLPRLIALKLGFGIIACVSALLLCIDRLVDNRKNKSHGKKEK